MISHPTARNGACRKSNPRFISLVLLCQTLDRTSRVPGMEKPAERKAARRFAKAIFC
jgi:hypothetical protein